MPVKYCAQTDCHGKTEYTVKVPKFCVECGVSFTAAFVTASKPHPIATRVPRATEPIEYEGDDDDANLRDVQSHARQLAASISARDFGLTLVKTDATPVTLGGILKDPDKYEVGTRSVSPTPPVQSD
jgi:hypothetical protein